MIFWRMIAGYRDKRTRDFAAGQRVKAFSGIERPARLKLDRLEAATAIKDLAALPGNVVRYDIRSRGAGRLEQRVGVWKLNWESGAITHLEPVEETLTYAAKPWFRDITGSVFQGEPAFGSAPLGRFVSPRVPIHAAV